MVSKEESPRKTPEKYPDKNQDAEKRNRKAPFSKKLHLQWIYFHREDQISFPQSFPDEQL